MNLSLRSGLNTLFLLIILSSFCSADMAVLSDDEMGDFIAAEGVCDIRLPDTCNTDPELMDTLSKEKEFIDQIPLNSHQTKQSAPIIIPSVTANDVVQHAQTMRFNEWFKHINK